MKVLVCGGREYSDWHFLSTMLDELHSIHNFKVVIEGEAPGADTLAAQWARNNGLIVRAFPADWVRYGRGAGPIRNKQMLDEGCSDLVVAFFDRPYTESKGTKDMCEQAHEAGVKVIKYGL